MTFTFGFGDYDRWKTTDSRDSEPYEICDQCGGNLQANWPKGGWVCERCDEEDDEIEYRQRQFDEQSSGDELPTGSRPDGL